MPVNDEEPRYQLVDSNDGSIVGSLYVNSSGEIAIQEGTNQNEATFDSDGKFSVPALEAEDSSTDPSSNGEFRRNGSDVKVYTGNSLKNLSDIGSGGSNVNEGLSEKSAGFDISYSKPGIDAGQWISADSTVSESRTQGIVYHDGHIYIAGTNNITTASTIYEFDTDGNYTGNSASVNYGHVNCLQVLQGNFWLMDFTDNKVIKLDFDADSVEGTFDYGGGAVMSSSPNNFVFIPRQDGDMRMVAVSELGASDAHVIDHEQALKDGTASGNIDATINEGISHYSDGAHYRNGYIYFTDHPDNNQNGAVYRVSVPFANQIGDGYQLKYDNVEWFHLFENWPDGGHIQDITYDDSTGYFYILTDNADQDVYRGQEKHHVTSPREFDEIEEWTLVDDETYKKAIEMEYDGASKKQTEQGVIRPALNRVLITVPFYDNGETSSGNGNRNYIGISDGDSGQVQIGVATHQNWGDDNYSVYDGSWTDSGISRLDNDWVLFGWYVSGGSVRTLISKDGGLTWELAHETANASTSFESVHLNTFEGQAKVGPFKINLEP